MRVRCYRTIPPLVAAQQMRLVVDSVLDVDHQAWRAVLGELGDPRTGLVGEAQVPGALCLEVAALDQVHEREKTRIEIG